MFIFTLIYGENVLLLMNKLFPQLNSFIYKRSYFKYGGKDFWIRFGGAVAGCRRKWRLMCVWVTARRLWFVLGG